MNGNQSPVAPLPAAASPQACFNWLQREDLTRLALKAYEMARCDCFPETEGFMVDGVAYCDRSTFRDSLLDNLALLVDRHGLEVGCWPSAAGLDRLDLVEADYRRRLALEDLAA